MGKEESKVWKRTTLSIDGVLGMLRVPLEVLLVRVIQIIVMLVQVELIDLGLAESPGGDSVLEQDVQLSV